MHRHSPTAPQRYPSSTKRQTVIDEQTISASCEPLWTSGNARSPPPQRSPDQPGRRRMVRTPATDSTLSDQRATFGTRLRCVHRALRPPRRTHARAPTDDLRRPAGARAGQPGPGPSRASSPRSRPRAPARPWVLPADRPTGTRPPICATSNAIFAASSGIPDLSSRAGCSAAVRSIVARRRGLRHTPEPRARPVVAPRGVGQRAVLALDEPPGGGQSPRPLPRKRHQPRPCRRRQRSRCAH